jgi:NADH-quinone oxidoreductase subunit L
LVSYLLIGFWYKRPTAVFANMKAFLVNRVGDFGFLLGIGIVLMYTGSFDYQTIFASAPQTMAGKTISLWEGSAWAVPTLACILLFIGAMGKSAQVPLHVWLPDSMEGPTPISALIHAATMVTAGIFMVSRMSPLFEMSETALSVILVIGATTALFMGLIGIVQNDIKRVVAYSTLSQLGYMTVALGASAYSAAIFHLMTHAFFKALLFLGAGSVIIAMHHEQDLRRMGGLRKYLPITFATAWIGTLALTGFPGTSGFFSKDAIIESVHASTRAGSSYAYFAVMAGVFVTAFYSFRMLYLAFHGSERFDAELPASEAHGADEDAHDDHAHDHGHDAPHEPGWVVTLPLILLAIPSLIVGYLLAKPMLAEHFFGAALQDGESMHAIAHHLEHGPTAFALHGFMGTPFILAFAGFALATFIYWKQAYKMDKEKILGPLHKLLDHKYYFDQFNQTVFAKGAVRLGKLLFAGGDRGLIDGLLVNGSASLIGRMGIAMRALQSGYLYQYAFTMILGLIIMLGFFVLYR